MTLARCSDLEHAGAPGPRTLADLLVMRAATGPDQILRFLRAEAEDTISYAELDAWARHIARELSRRAVPGERVLILEEPGISYVASLFGVLYAGMVAVPCYPPDPRRLERTLGRVATIAKSARAALSLVDERFTLQVAEALASGVGNGALDVLSVPARPQQADASRLALAAAPHEAAILQYTSGSTGAPKGVILTHECLLRNLVSIRDALLYHAGSTSVSWLPPYHDMGLIAGILEPLYAGSQVVLMSPATLAQQPLRWLRAISQYGGTISGGPNFAYELCAKRASQADLEQLDLGSWEVAFNGAEPISAATLERFTRVFARCGFRREAWLPCYGLAEATLLVSSARPGSGPRLLSAHAGHLRRDRLVLTTDLADSTSRSAKIVSCGTPQDLRVQVVNPERRTRCARGEIGELWVQGPSVARGYYGLADESQVTFQAQLADQPEAGGWLRTGDLCAQLPDGELAITGRLKDLIIIRGLNHYPQDIERSVEQSHARVRVGRVVACALLVDGREELGCIAELSAGDADAGLLDAVAQRIRERVAEEHGLAVHSVVLAASGAVQLTSSGKIMRRETRARFLAGTLSTLLVSVPEQERTARGRAPESETERRVAELFASVLGLSPLGVDDDLFELGGDSITAAQIAARLSPAAIEQALQAVLVSRTIAAVASWLDAGTAKASAPPRASGAAAPAVLLDAVCELAREVLKAEQIEPASDFFALGGSSLQAMLLLARIRERLGVELALESVLEHPTLAALAALIERRRAEAPDTPQEQALAPIRLEPMQRPDHVPLSFAQQRLWFVDRFRSSSLAYSIPIALRLYGKLNRAALARTFHAIVVRHEALRTTFELRQGGPAQVVQAPPAEWPMPVLDRRGLALEERPQVASRIATDESRRPFELERGPLFRTSLIEFADDDHVLMLTMHHIVSDGWSMGVLVRELVSHYGHFAGDEPLRLPPLPLQYVDFALWQRRVLSDQRLAPSLEFFRSQLAGVEPLQLPYDRERPDTPSGKGKILAFVIDAGVIERLQQLANDESATLFMVLVASFRAALYRITRQSNFAIGVPVANRTHPQLEQLIGFFVNTVALRLDLGDDPSFTELLKREKRGALLAFGHQEVPFEKVVELLGLERDARQPPLISAMFALQNAPLSAPRLPGLEIDAVWVDSETSKFDLTISLMPWNGEFRGQIEYATDLFEASTVQALIDVYLETMSQLAAAPGRRLSELESAPLSLSPQLAGPRAAMPEARAQLAVEPAIAPRTETESLLQLLASEVLDGEQLGMRNDFFRHGGNSLRSVLLLARVAERFEVQIPIEAFFAAPNLESLALMVEAQRDTQGATSGAREARCVDITTNAGPLRLFMVHALQGDVMVYHALSRELRDFCSVTGLAVVAHGRRSIPAMAEAYARLIAQAQPTGAILLGGFSFGGLVAYETARVLEQLGRETELVLLDAHVERAGQPVDANERAAAVNEARSLAELLSPERLARQLQTCEAHLEALSSYLPGRHAGRALVVRAARAASAADLGWSRLIDGPLAFASIDADHHGLLLNPNVIDVAETIRAALAARLSPTSQP